MRVGVRRATWRVKRTVQSSVSQRPEWRVPRAVRCVLSHCDTFPIILASAYGLLYRMLGRVCTCGSRHRSRFESVGSQRALDCSVIWPTSGSTSALAPELYWATHTVVSQLSKPRHHYVSSVVENTTEGICQAVAGPPKAPIQAVQNSRTAHRFFSRRPSHIPHKTLSNRRNAVYLYSRTADEDC